MANRQYAPSYLPPVPHGQVSEVSDSETHSRNLLGPTFFDLYDLRAEGGTAQPLPPDFIAPGNSPFIIASDEEFTASVKIKFNNSPLTKLLLCLGTTIKVTFSFEGIGANATEVDLVATETTEKDKLEYTIKWTGTPDFAELTAGFYEIAAIAEIGPAKHPCAQFIFGYGYVAKALLQVYKAFS